MNHLVLDPATDMHTEIEKIKLQEGQVFFTALYWKDAMDIAKIYGCTEDAYALEALSSKIDLGARTSIPLFDRPTLIVVSENQPLDTARLAWNNVRKSIEKSLSPISLSYQKSELSSSPLPLRKSFKR